MSIDEAIAKLDLIASDAFEGGNANEFRQLADWLRELWALTEAEKEIRRLTVVWEEGQGIQKCIDILDKWHGEVKKNENEP